MGDNVRIFNTVKEYPDMIKIYFYKEPYTLPSHTSGRPRRDSKNPDAMSISRSIRRTKTVISDYVLCNGFDYFCTFTFNCRGCPSKFNCDNKPCKCLKSECMRYDEGRSRTKMSMWLHRQGKLARDNKKDFKYLIVPEYHDDGAVHFHAMISGYCGVLKDSKKRQNDRIVYNMPGYRSGFTTAVRIDDNTGAVANYIKKYITKDMPLISGKKRYWCSNNLSVPKKTINTFKSFNIKPLFMHKVYDADYFEVFEAVKVN